MGLHAIAAGLERHCRRPDRWRIYRATDGAQVSFFLVALPSRGLCAIVGRVEHELVLVLHLRRLGTEVACPQVQRDSNA